MLTQNLLFLVCFSSCTMIAFKAACLLPCFEVFLQTAVFSANKQELAARRKIICLLFPNTLLLYHDRRQNCKSCNHQPHCQCCRNRRCSCQIFVTFTTRLWKQQHQQQHQRQQRWWLWQWSCKGVPAIVPGRWQLIFVNSAVKIHACKNSTLGGEGVGCSAANIDNKNWKQAKQM